MKVSARLVSLVFVVLAIVTAGAATMQDKAGQTASRRKRAGVPELADAGTTHGGDVPVQRRRPLRLALHPSRAQRRPAADDDPGAEEGRAGLVEASLSAEGYNKSERIRQLEQILYDREGRAMRDTELTSS